MYLLGLLKTAPVWQKQRWLQSLGRLAWTLKATSFRLPCVLILLVIAPVPAPLLKCRGLRSLIQKNPVPFWSASIGPGWIKCMSKELKEAKIAGEATPVSPMTSAPPVTGILAQSHSLTACFRIQALDGLYLEYTLQWVKFWKCWTTS